MNGCVDEEVGGGGCLNGVNAGTGGNPQSRYGGSECDD